MKKLLIDIGGTSIKSILYEDGKYNKYLQKTIDRNDPQKTLVSLINEYNVVDISQILIAATGVINKEGKVVNVNGIIKNYLYWNIKKEIEETFNIYTIVINDVNAFAYSKKYNKSTYYLTIGTGIGGAFREKNEILMGENGAASEIGFMLIDGKRYEDLASTRALIEIANNEYGLNIDTGKEFFEKFSLDLKNETYKKVFEYWCDNLLKGLINICFLFNPKNIVIGGAISSQEELIKPILLRKLQENLPGIFYKDLSLIFSESPKYSIFEGLINYEKLMR